MKLWKKLMMILTFLFSNNQDNDKIKAEISDTWFSGVDNELTSISEYLEAIGK